MSEETRPVGRPTLLTAEVKDKILELAEQGKTNKQIAEIIGVHEKTVDRWAKTYDQFGWALRLAKQEADELVEAALFQRAIGYSHPAVKIFNEKGDIIEHEYTEHHPPDTKAAEMWLRNRRPDQWQKSADDNPTNVQVNNISLTDDQLLNLVLKAKEPKK